jgi:hypothetical protein
MKPIPHSTRRPARNIGLTTLFLLIVAPVAAQSGGEYDMSRSTVSPGEMWCTGGDYELSGTVSTSGAGAMSGGNYAMTGGFWFGCVPGDCDCDADVDLQNFADLAACLQGPDGGPLQLECACFDSDDSGHVDLKDVADFQEWFTG